MKSVEVLLNSGRCKRFEGERVAGEHKSPTLRFEGVFAVITDTRGRITAIPASEIKEVREYFK
jgi:hypothetical protein